MGLMKEVDIEIKNSYALSYLDHRISVIEEFLNSKRRYRRWLRRKGKKLLEKSRKEDK